MKIVKFSILALLTAMPTVALGDVVGSVDFDSPDVGVISSSVPTLDGGPGDSFAVGSANSWPTAGGAPFGLMDNSVGAVGTSTAFAGDKEGVYGVNSNFDNKFFGLSDSDEFGPDQTASWTFDVADFDTLVLSIGFGAISDTASFGGFDAASSLVFSVSIDGGASQTAFSIVPNAAANTFSYRPMDDGTVTPDDGGNGPLQATGDNLVTKTLADTGLLGLDTYLDKTPASGPGAGVLDTFSTAINGTGSQLTLTLVANLPFETAAFDNIVISGTPIPEPASLALLGLGGLAMLARRRSA